MKSATATFIALGIAFSFSACNNTAQKTTAPVKQQAVIKTEPPRKETGVNAAEEMLAKSAGDMLNTYAQMHAGAKGEAPGSFHDFVVSGKSSDASAGLKELSLEKCAINDAEIACPDDVYTTVRVTYRLDDAGTVTTDVQSKY